MNKTNSCVLLLIGMFSGIIAIVSARDINLSGDQTQIPRENARPESQSGVSADTVFAFSEKDFFEKKIDTHHWLAFGWEEDHPKAVSTMGGMMYARRPQLSKMDDHSWAHSKAPWHPQSAAATVFLVAVDNGKPFYPDEKAPNRRKAIKWMLADEYLPSPLSEWQVGEVTVRIQHFGARILDKRVDAVYSRVILTNQGSINHTVHLLVCGEAIAERCLPLIAQKPDFGKQGMIFHSELTSGGRVIYDFVSPANGQATKDEVLSAGGFNRRLMAERQRIDCKLACFTHPISLPDQRFVNLWKSSQIYMWNATVKTQKDLEQRGSGGNIHGFYQYDRVFDHDVPDMVVQYILEGNWELARPIMLGSTFDRLGSGNLQAENYLDAIPKYIIAMAQYLQISGDQEFFSADIREKIRRCAHIIHQRRVSQLKPELRGKGAYGLLDKSNSLDNGNNFLLIDNFAALHGLAAYVYFCSKFSDKDEAAWAINEMADLTSCLNAALDLTMKEQGNSWYNACFSFDWNERLLQGPGNWFGTTLMMPTFPWQAYLKGFESGGSWQDHFDASVEKWEQQSLNLGNPKGSWGAWWGAKYGSAYNAGMALPLLHSEKYRTKTIASVEWLLDNMSAPYQWGESFHAPATPGDWTRPEVDHETWALGFIRQAILQSCISLRTDGVVIIGRGIPDHWLTSGIPVSWRRVRINDGRILDFSIKAVQQTLEVLFEGDTPLGDIQLNLPMLLNNIAGVMVDDLPFDKRIDNKRGVITVPPGTKRIAIRLRSLPAQSNN